MARDSEWDNADTLDAEPVRGAAPQARGAQVLAERYELVALLGTGGMGAVYRARDRELEETVALKVLRRDLVDGAAALERFRGEVKVTRRITHPNVVRTFDIGEHQGERFLTMEYVDGSSLGALLAERGALETANAVRIAASVASGLAAAHAAGVIHRDLKPDNVLIAKDGRVVVTDFGIARLLSEAAQRTGKNQMLGTPLYMAPEQVEGANADGRTDVYALGLVLYEMLVGHPAWSGETLIAIAAQRLVRPPPDPRDAKAHVPPAIAELVLRCLSRASDARPDAKWLAAELERIGAASAPASIEIDLRRAERTLAVMPLSAGPELATIAEGLSIDLVDALSAVHGVKVRAHSRDVAESDPTAFGHALRVQAVVGGSVQSSGGEVSIRLRLVSVADGFQLWSGRFKRPIGAVLGANDEAASEIAAALDSLVSGPPRNTGVPTAVELYLRARAELSGTFLPTPEVGALLERAYRLDPDNPVIVAELAMHGARGGAPERMSPEQTAEARALAERAKRLAPRSAEPYAALARIHYQTGDGSAAVRELLTAVENAPSSALAHDLLGRILVETELGDAALAHIERTIWLDPSFHFARIDRARLLAFRGEWDEVDRTLAELRVRSPVHHYLAAVRMACWNDRFVHEPERPPSKDNPVVDIGKIFWRVLTAKTLSDADRERFESQPWPAPPRGARLMHQIMAEMLGYLGQDGAALDSVRGAVDAGLTDIAWMRHCPAISRLRAMEAFGALAAQVAERAAPIAKLYLESGFRMP